MRPLRCPECGSIGCPAHNAAALRDLLAPVSGCCGKPLETGPDGVWCTGCQRLVLESGLGGQS